MRIARQISPGVFYHLISRFVDRRWEFGDVDERARYLDHLARALDETDWRCLAYALMSNHIHLGMVAGEAPLGGLLKRTNSPFARWMNERHGRLGPVFAERPAAWAIRPEHVGATLAYIHNNPVRAGVVRTASESSWTSYPAYIGQVPTPSWLDTAEGLARAGLAAPALETMTASQATASSEVARIQRAAHKRGAVEVATPTATPTETPLVARPFARIRPDPRKVIEVVADVIKLDPATFSSRRTASDCVRARCIAAHAGAALGLTSSEIASALGVSRQTIAQLARRRLDEAGDASVIVIRDRLTTFTPSPANTAQRHGVVVRRS
jgi:REP element-mobilizing transposase RayT